MHGLRRKLVRMVNAMAVRLTMTKAVKIYRLRNQTGFLPEMLRVIFPADTIVNTRSSRPEGMGHELCKCWLPIIVTCS